MQIKEFKGRKHLRWNKRTFICIREVRKVSSEENILHAISQLCEPWQERDTGFCSFRSWTLFIIPVLQTCAERINNSEIMLYLEKLRPSESCFPDGSHYQNFTKWQSSSQSNPILKGHKVMPPCSPVWQDQVTLGVPFQTSSNPSRTRILSSSLKEKNTVGSDREGPTPLSSKPGHALVGTVRDKFVTTCCNII